MKKTFLAKRNALLSSANLSWGTLALLLALLTLLVRLVAPNFFLHVFAPAFGVADSIAAESHTFFNSFGDTATLAAKNEQLMNENTALASENAALTEKEASLTALLGTQSSSRALAQSILAGVVMRPPESPYDTLVLSVGSDRGVELGMEAFGAGGGAMQASLSRSAGVVVGDVVFAPGPGMLPIGTVTRIDSDPSASGVTLRIMPALNPFSLTWVELRSTGALRDAFYTATSTAL